MTKKTRSAKQYLVFISHSTKDRWVAKQMSNLIEEKGREWGIKTFLDEKDIDGGDSIPESIRINIQKCDEFLLLLSRYSVNRPWVLIELGAAWGLEKRVVTIIDKVTPDEMPEVISPYKAIDINNFDQYIAQLLGRAKESRKNE
ncbi:toll/interleukin-1 receptor domain-containing protein [candidate division KSB1 bacterium]|nr:toll/interleukin-1 receptor domain-containing protein [candidate division KSB1 bacterium]MCH8021068.1 toll/interleukin-1 receptor domain-containing protein [candidate division KSB1 bacterium]MCH8872374.1 toll/interleukin-1 receptor domain-containing protein [candidate division KSB1 bacterium]